MKYALTAIAVTLVLTGCGQELTEHQTKEARSVALEQLNAEKELLSVVIKEIKKSDPAIFDAQFFIDKDGNRALNVYKMDEGQVVTYEIPSAVINGMLESETKRLAEKPQASSGASSGETFVSSMGGAVAGMLIANMLMNNNSTRSSMSSYEHDRKNRTTTYSSAVVSNTNRAAINAARSGQPISKGAGLANGLTNSSNMGAVGRSTGGSFSSGARSSVTSGG